MRPTFFHDENKRVTLKYLMKRFSVPENDGTLKWDTLNQADHISLYQRINHV